MRFPAPDRLNFLHVAIFAIVIFVAQELEGTDLLFAVLTACYTLLWAAAFNIAGGIRYASGAFVFFNGFLNAIIGLTFKAVLLEPGDRNLVSPNATMFCYCVGMVSILCAVFFCRGLRPERGLLTGLDSVEAFKSAAITCLVVGIAIKAVTTLGGSSNGIITVLSQINKFPEMSIMLGTIYAIRHSNGRHSMNWIVVVGLAMDLIWGLVFFSKEGMLLGFAAWFIAAALEGYNFRGLQIAVLAGGFAFFAYYLAPYSQYVRGFRVTGFAANEAVALRYLGDLNETRRLYEATLTNFDLSDEPHLFDQREGFMDRLIVIPADDNLITYTNKGNVFGLAPTYAAYANYVPHFIWRNKPVFNTGNVYAHELGELSEEDESTGIAFSATADAYHQAKWLGLLLLMPLDLFLYFIVTDTVIGSAKWAPWVMIPILNLSEIGPEGGLDGPIYAAWYGIFAMVFIVWTIKRGAPFVLRVLRRPAIATLVGMPSSGIHTGPVSTTGPKEVIP